MLEKWEWEKKIAFCIALKLQLLYVYVFRYCSQKWMHLNFVVVLCFSTYHVMCANLGRAQKHKSQIQLISRLYCHCVHT